METKKTLKCVQTVFTGHPFPNFYTEKIPEGETALRRALLIPTSYLFRTFERKINGEELGPIKNCSPITYIANGEEYIFNLEKLDEFKKEFGDENFSRLKNEIIEKGVKFAVRTRNGYFRSLKEGDIVVSEKTGKGINWEE